MPTAEDLIKKVINNNTVKVQIMTPELEKKFEEMEERQTEQHEETLQSQKKTQETLKKTQGGDSSNFKEGGELINKGIKGLTGVDLGGKFNDLKDKVGNLGDIFRGINKFIFGSYIGEAESTRAQIKGNIIADKSLKELKDISDAQRKAQTASRIQVDQEENFEKLDEILGPDATDLNKEGATPDPTNLRDVIRNFIEEAEAGFYLDDELNQDKVARREAINKILNDFGAEGDVRDTLGEFLKNINRLSYELRSQNLDPTGMIGKEGDQLGQLKINRDTGKFDDNPKTILEDINRQVADSEQFVNKKTGEVIQQFSDLSDKQQKIVLTSQKFQDDLKEKLGDDYESFNPFSAAEVDAAGGAKQFYNTLSENTRDTIENLRNIFEGEYYQDIKARSERARQAREEEKGLDDTVDNNQFSQGEMIDEEYNQQSMTHFGDISKILEFLQTQASLEKSKDDISDLKGMEMSEGGILVPKDKDGTDGTGTGAFGEGGKDGKNANPLLNALAFKGATDGLNTFGGQKPNQTTGKTGGKAGNVRAGGIAGGLAALGRGALAFLKGPIGLTLIGAAAIGAGVVFARENNTLDDEDKGEGDSDYAKERKEELDQKRTELQGDETNWLGMQKITAESIIDDNTWAGGTSTMDSIGNLFSNWGESQIFFDKLNQDDALLRLDQLMAADDLIGDDLSKEDRKRLDQELRDAQTAAQKQLQEMQEQTGERLTLEELGKYYDFEVLGENMLKNLQPPQSVTDNSVINNNTTITSANPRQYDNDIDRAQTAYT